MLVYCSDARLYLIVIQKAFNPRSRPGGARDQPPEGSKPAGSRSRHCQTHLFCTRPRWSPEAAAALAQQSLRAWPAWGLRLALPAVLASDWTKPLREFAPPAGNAR